MFANRRAHEVWKPKRAGRAKVELDIEQVSIFQCPVCINGKYRGIWIFEKRSKKILSSFGSCSVYDSRHPVL